MQNLPFSRLPGMNSLFLDFIEEPARVSAHYPSPGTTPSRDLKHRSRLCDILERQNREYGNSNAGPLLAKLREQGTFCVITGQQVGLLTGPLYTLWKALTVLRLCEQWQQQGIPCVPVFWMATEDHNWHEILNLGLLNEDFELMQYSLKDYFFLERKPTGSVPVTHGEVRKILLRVFRDFHLPEIKEIYSQGTLASAFARTLLHVLRDYPLLIVDPSDAELKHLAAPFFEMFFERKEVLLQTLARQNDLLRAQNYPVQVKMDEGVLPLFSVRDGERSYLKREIVHLPSPENLSPSALLRPLFQDYLFPTLAYVGGPAEIAYFAQLHPWYGVLEMQQPRIAARAGLTLLPALTQNFLNSKRLGPEELYIKEDILLDALIQDSRVDLVKKELRQARDSLETNLGNVKARATTVDTTLRKAIETAERKIQYQIEKVERKTLLAVRRKNDLLARQLRKAKNVIYPDDKLQERCLNVFSFASRLPEMLHDIYSQFDPEPKEHQWVAI